MGKEFAGGWGACANFLVQMAYYWALNVMAHFLAITAH